jgi:predicted CXXCH cytochrome family protein
MTCTDCHNPHRSEETMRFTRRADDQCTRCHTDKRGPFVFAHDVTSVGEGCQTCHAPHGSPNNKLTKLNGRGLCLQCHSDVAADPQHQLRPGNCWSAGCHADFHGSQTSSVFIATGARALQSRVLRSPSQRDFGFGNYPSAIRHPPSAILAWLAATPSEEKEKKEALPPKQYEVEATGSYQTLGVDGNLSKYHQYNVKPDAFFSDSLRLKLFDKTGFGFGSLRWTGVDEPTQTFALWLDGLAPTRTTLRYDYDRASFFIEPSLDRVTVSERRNQNFLLRLLPSDKTPALDLIGQSQRVNAPGLSRLRSGGVPGSLNYRTTSVGPQLRVPVGSGLFGFGFTHESFTDNTQFLPGASSNVWQFRYDGDIGAKTSAFASFNNALIQQSGLLGTSAVRQTQVGAVSTPTRHLTVSALLSFDDIDMPNTFNAFVTDNDALTLCVRYRPKARLLLEGGYEHSAVKRVNATHTFIDASRWDGGWLVLRAAPAPHVNFLLKHVRRRLDDPPPANVLGLATTSSLFFDEDDRTDAQLTFMLPRDAILYTSYHRTKRDNDARDVGFRLNSWNAGLSAPLSAKLSMNVDWNRQRWSGRGDVLMNDPLLLNFGRPLTSDGNYINLGLAYATGKATWTTHLYRFRSSGGESVRGRGIGIGYERPLFKQCAARLQVGWDDYEDRFLPGFDNSDSFIRLDLLRRF